MPRAIARTFIILIVLAGHLVAVAFVVNLLRVPRVNLSSSMSKLPLGYLLTDSPQVHNTTPSKNHMHGTSVPETVLDSLVKKPLNNSEPSTKTGFNAQHYRTSDELHTRAAPVEEWNIPNHLIPDNKSIEIVFTVWISSSGTVDWIEILNADEDLAWSSEIRSQLMKTAMEPATFNEEAVASTMTVGVLIESRH